MLFPLAMIGLGIAIGLGWRWLCGGSERERGAYVQGYRDGVSYGNDGFESAVIAAKLAHEQVRDWRSRHGALERAWGSLKEERMN